MSLKIPSDLEEEILSRVPTKFLSRLRFVCKQWNSLFHDLIFIEKHLSNHASPQEFMLWHPRSFYSKLINVEIHLNSDNIALSSLKYHDLTSRIPPSNGRKICRIIHSDGLLLYVTNHGLEVSNPFLKQERSIQTVNHYAFKGKESALVHCSSTYSLGYCNKLSNGYKILRLHPRCLFSGPRAEIFEFTLGKWRVLDVSFFDWFPACLGLAVSFKGNSYVIAVRKDTLQGFIQSFNFATERFKPFSNLPFNYVYPDYLCMSVLGGDRLSVLEQCIAKKIRIWVTNKIGNGIEISWSKFMTVNLDLYFMDLNFFVEENKRKTLVLYTEDIMAQSIYIFEEGGRFIRLDGRHNWHHSSNYVPSLVPIP
ncbi:PREDICTED: putative F-box protein At3g16590 isoform X1 [Tarenaya hassleriana]|uniref:putative F-box protein At3g16590 isoform X1 n=1 Tax=Tarenaya hassleriana TaxID=28532 RepID=UPI00053C49DF|nr:PREDICTED: putative F-box protein At3g16590 isoform X1 [Tarenaya hassleriana]